MSRRAMGRRVAAGSVVGTALVISLTGCLGESNDTTGGGIKLAAAEAIAKSSQKAGQADTFKATLTLDNNGTEGTNTVRASGQFRLKPDLAFSVNVDEVKRNGSSLPGGGAQVILLDRVGYARVPQLSAFAGGKQWVKVDLNKAGSTFGVNVDQILSQVEKVNPAQQTKMFTGSKDVRTVGTETIDGVKTTHYRGTVTVDDALASLDAEARKTVQQYYTPSATDKISFDLWTDGDELPRKMVSKVNNAKDEHSTVTVVYRDYNESVTVTAPPADQVGDFSLPR